jgi:uncharacterized membrane protein
MAAALSLLVRLGHVLGMAVLLGGSGLAWYALRTGDASLPLLGGFESVFWATMGAMLVTGVGNLGALGAPGPGTRWGTVLTIKLLVLLGVVLGSGVRTFAVHRLADRVDPLDDRRVTGRLRIAYGTTTGAFVVVVALAEVLAHG